MISRIIIFAMTFLIPLSAVCDGCNDCRQNPSATELLRLVQGVLNNGILLLPQLQPQLISQLQTIITTGGIAVVAAARNLQAQPGATGPHQVLQALRET